MNADRLVFLPDEDEPDYEAIAQALGGVTRLTLDERGRVLVPVEIKGDEG